MRESLGTVRLHRFVCDVCEVSVESRSKASGAVPLPEGWVRVDLKVNNVSTSGELCSVGCAEAFTSRGLEVLHAPAQ